MNTVFYGYAFLIYTATEWIALGNTIQVVHPVNVGAYAGIDQAAWYRYESQKATYIAYKRFKDATVRMVIHIFGEHVFLSLHDAHGHIIGHTPVELIAYLVDIYATNT